MLIILQVKKNAKIPLIQPSVELWQREENVLRTRIGCGKNAAMLVKVSCILSKKHSPSKTPITSDRFETNI